MSQTVEEKSFQFAIRIVNLNKYLRSEHKDYTLTTQLLKSGTSIGANVAEAQQAQSKADFIAKLCIALKEASETSYWLRFLHATGYLSRLEYDSVISDCKELEKMLTAIIRTAREIQDRDED